MLLLFLIRVKNFSKINVIFKKNILINIIINLYIMENQIIIDKIEDDEEEINEELNDDDEKCNVECNEEHYEEKRPRHDSLVVDDHESILETDNLLNNQKYIEEVPYIDVFEKTVHKIYDNVTYILSYLVDMTVYGYFYLKNKIVKNNNNEYARVPQGLVNEL